MSSSKSQFALFGLDLAAVGRYFVDGWADAAAWPLFRWSNPQAPVRVIDADGRVSTRLGVSAASVSFKGKVERVEGATKRFSHTLPDENRGVRFSGDGGRIELWTRADRAPSIPTSRRCAANSAPISCARCMASGSVATS